MCLGRSQEMLKIALYSGNVFSRCSITAETSLRPSWRHSFPETGEQFWTILWIRVDPASLAKKVQIISIDVHLIGSFKCNQMLRLQIKRFSLVSFWLSFMLIPSARTEDITLIVGHEEEKCFFILLKNHFINKIVELKSDDVLLFSILINVRTLPTKLIRFERFIWNISSCPTLNLMSASQTLGAHLQSAYLKLVIICFFHKISNFFLCTKLTHITLLYIYLYIEHSSITLHLFFHCVKHT